MRKGYPRTLRRALERRSAPAPWPSGLSSALTMPSISGITVTPQTALSFSAYFAGIRVISEDVASLPLQVFRRLDGGGAKLERDHPVSKLFGRSPSGKAKECTSLQWRESWISHALGWGNGYAEIEWTKGSVPLSLNLLNPGSIRPDRTDDKRLYYEQTTDGKKLWPHQVLHLAGLGFNGLVGYSPVALAREAIGLGKAAEQFGASLFGNGAIPKGVLKHPGKLKPEARENLRNSINQRHQSSANANKLMVLEEGMDWVNTQIAPEDAQFLATRQFQVLEIARILRLPPHKIGDYSQSHLANIEASNLDYLMTVLRPWCLRIEESADLKLLTDAEYEAGLYTRHDIRALLRASIKDRSDFYQKMFQFGMSPDEIREFEDMNPIGDAAGGSKRFRPANLVPLDQDDEAIAEAAATKPAFGEKPPGDNEGGDGKGGE